MPDTNLSSGDLFQNKKNENTIQTKQIRKRSPETGYKFKMCVGVGAKFQNKKQNRNTHAARDKQMIRSDANGENYHR